MFCVGNNGVDHPIMHVPRPETLLFLPKERERGREANICNQTHISLPANVDIFRGIFLVLFQGNQKHLCLISFYPTKLCFLWHAWKKRNSRSTVARGGGPLVCLPLTLNINGHSLAQSSERARKNRIHICLFALLSTYIFLLKISDCSDDDW